MSRDKEATDMDITALSLVPRYMMSTAWMTAAHVASIGIGTMDNNKVPKLNFYCNSVPSIANSLQDVSLNRGQQPLYLQIIAWSLVNANLKLEAFKLEICLMRLGLHWYLLDR